MNNLCRLRRIFKLFIDRSFRIQDCRRMHDLAGVILHDNHVNHRRMYGYKSADKNSDDR